MGKKATGGFAEDSADTVQSLPTTNGSQLSLFPWLRELAGNTECFEADEAYFLNTGSWVNNAGKAVFYSPHHAVLAAAGFISQEKYGIYKPPPMDGFVQLYTQKLAEVAAGAAIPNAMVVNSLPVAPDSTHITDNQLVAPDKLAMIDLKLKGTLLRLITSSGRRRHYMDSVGPSGSALLVKLNEDSKLAESQYSQSPYSRQIKGQLAEAMRRKLTHLSLEEFDEIKDLIEELNSQLISDDQFSDRYRAEHYIKLVHGLKSPAIKTALTLDLRVNSVVHGDLQSTISAITRVISSELIDLETERLEEVNGKAFKAQDARKNNIKPPTTPCPICGSMKHWSKNCWQNPNADDETKKRAPKNTPAGQAWARKQTASTAKGNSAAAKSEPNKPPQEETEVAALLSKQDDLLAAALDNRDPSNIEIGRAALAFNVADEYSSTNFPDPNIRLQQDFFDYQSSESDDLIDFDDEEEDLHKPTMLNPFAQRGEVRDASASLAVGRPISPPPVPALPASQGLQPTPPDLQDDATMLSQLESARQRLNARALHPLHNNRREPQACNTSQGSLTTTFRTNQQYHRTLQLTESTREESGQTVNPLPKQHSTTFIIILSVFVALAASICTSVAVIISIKWLDRSGMQSCHYSNCVASLQQSLTFGGRLILSSLNKQLVNTCCGEVIHWTVIHILFDLFMMILRVPLFALLSQCGTTRTSTKSAGSCRHHFVRLALHCHRTSMQAVAKRHRLDPHCNSTCTALTAITGSPHPHS